MYPLIPINGLPQKALYMEITIDKEEDKATKMTVYDYLMSADWCQGIEPTDQIGWYFIITTCQQVNKAREWLDNNLKDMFIEHIPRYSTFKLIKGCPFPQRAKKPCFHVQLGTYADLLRNQYTVSPNEPNNPTKWKKSPLPKTQYPTQKTLIFDCTEYPELTNSAPKCTQNETSKPPTTEKPVNSPTPQLFTAQSLQAQIIEDMKKDLTKMFSKELSDLCKEMTNQLHTISKTIKTNVNSQIAEVL